MSFYYKQNFISPEPLFALVKEELKGYMDTGAIDSTLFPLWTKKCLDKLGRASLPINQAMLCVDNFEAKLPDEFVAIREAWSCEEETSIYKEANSKYTQIMEESVRVDDANYYCTGCADNEPPDIIKAIYKTTNTVAFAWTKQRLLTPGNSYPSCPDDLYCANFNAISDHSYDVRDNKFVTTFRSGKVYIQYYSSETDGENQLIPDVYEIKEFIEAFLKQKLFEQLYNQATDDSQRAAQIKYKEYEQKADEAYIMADTENKKEDVYRKQRAIRRTQNRFRNYDIR